MATQQQRSEQHRAAQASFAALAVAALARAWPRLFDVHDLKDSSRRLSPVLTTLVRQYGRASASAALTQYRNERRLARAGGSFSPKMPVLPSASTIEATIERSLSPLYGTPTPEQITNAEKALESSLEQIVLDQSRTALIDAVRDDREAKGWARVTEPGACYFCALLATRGAVYKTRGTASFQAHRRYPNGTGGDCRCHAEPVFNAYEPPAQVRQWMADHKRLKKENGGTLSLIQWRRAFEGRDGTDRAPLADSLG